MQSGVHMPTPGTAGEQSSDLRREAGIGRFDHRTRWGRRVEVEWNLERLGTLKDWPEEVIVEVATANVATDLRAPEPVHLDGALQLVGGGFRCWRGKRSESGEARRMPLHGGPELIVCVTGDCDGIGGIKLLQTGGHQREDLKINRCGIHRSDASSVQIEKLCLQLGKRSEVELQVRCGRIKQCLSRVVLFEGYGMHYCVLS